MQRSFSHIWDGTDVQVDWRRSCTYGRAPNAIDISQGSLTCPTYTDTGPNVTSEWMIKVVILTNIVGKQQRSSNLWAKQNNISNTQCQPGPLVFHIAVAVKKSRQTRFSCWFNNLVPVSSQAVLLFTNIRKPLLVCCYKVNMTSLV